MFASSRGKKRNTVAQLVEGWTRDQTVASSRLTAAGVTVLCP